MLKYNNLKTSRNNHGEVWQCPTLSCSFYFARREVTSLTNPKLFFHYTAKFITIFFLFLLILPACQHLPTSMIISICRPLSTLWTTFIPDALKICRTFLTPIGYYWLADSFFSYFPSAAPLRSLPLPFFFLIPNSNATLCCPC